MQSVSESYTKIAGRIVHYAKSVHMCFLQISTGFECSPEKQYNSIMAKIAFISSLLLKYLFTLNLNQLNLRNVDLEALLDYDSLDFCSNQIATYVYVWWPGRKVIWTSSIPKLEDYSGQLLNLER